MEKIRIQKNTVQETLVIPLYARKKCTELFPQLFSDPASAELYHTLDYDFSALDKKSGSLMQVFGFLECAMRQNDLAWEIKDYLKSHPRAAVVNLGCGLDMTGRNCDNGTCKIYNLDFPEVIYVRNMLAPAGERERNIPADLNQADWFAEIDASEGAVFFAAGVFYYFQTEQVKALFQKMEKCFPGGRLVFDAAGKAAVKLMLKTWIKEADIKDVSAYFAVKDAPAELASWFEQAAVSARGYMLGYQKLEGEGITGIHRFLARLGDRKMHMQIVRICFAH